MQIIHGYWDPRNLCFIEESDTDQLELSVLDGSGRAKRSPSGASASDPGSADASYKTKKC